MGLLAILKKMKQKEREVRLLMLYPPQRRSRAGSGAPPGGRCRAPPAGSGVRRPALPNCPWRHHAGPTNRHGGPGGTASPAWGNRIPGLELGPAQRAAETGLQAQRRDRTAQVSGLVGPGGDSDATTRWPGPSGGPLPSQL
ncbi:hypothetical protein P7K49_021546 [Saguinus oedipus]|uniref:Uncharacterized protein n=1 Tax=Saguinus oedipus TaxID=9490 RepID=A0ABQ9UT01_SAGOE|nr:hypothetical protein P7K49_021546 [Saguinus oedipus]